MHKAVGVGISGGSSGCLGSLLETKLFYFHGEFSEKSGKGNENQVKLTNQTPKFSGKNIKIGISFFFFRRRRPLCFSAHRKVQLSKIFERKNAIIFLSSNLNICFGCSKEPSH